MFRSKDFDIKMFMRAVLTIAFPIALQNLMSTTASMVDTIMIGTQGELAVAAVGICSQINSLFFSSYFGFAGGSLLFFAQYWGAKDTKGINRAFGISAFFMLLVAFVFGTIAVLNPAFILRIYTDKEAIILMGMPYLRIIGFAAPFTVLVMIMNFFLRSTERVKAPLVCSIAGILVNVTLNWLLIFGRFGLPKMGVAGAAVGTLCSQLINFILLFIYIMRDQETVKLRLREMFGWGEGFFSIYFKKSFPIIMNEMFYGIGQMLINIVIGHQDESAIAAMAAFRVLEGFVFAFFGGLADASAVVVGKEVGSGRHMRGYQYVKGFSVLCPAITFTIVLIFLIFNQPLLALFGLGAQALSYGKYMLLIYLFFGAIRTCNYIMNSCYRAGGESVYGTVLEIICLFTLSVPVTWVAGMVLELPFLAVFACVYTDEILRLIFEIRYTRSCKWVKPVTEIGKNKLEEFHIELKELRKNKKVGS